jgi:hypothetical protein
VSLMKRRGALTSPRVWFLNTTSSSHLQQHSKPGQVTPYVRNVAQQHVLCVGPQQHPWACVLTSSATWPLSPLTPQDHARQGQSGARGVMEAFRNTVLGVYQPPSACTAARSTHSQAFSTCCASNAAATDTPCQCPLPAASQMCQPPAAQHAPASSSPSHVFPARFSAHKATNLAQCKTKLDTSRTRTCA